MLNPRLGRGRLHMQRLEHAKALAACEEALDLAPGEPTIPHCIGMSYAALGDKAKAVDWLTRAVRIKPMADAYYQLGIIYYDMGDKAAAASSALSRATELALADERRHGVTVPWLTQGYWLLGTVEGVLNRRREQCRAWMTYLERNPTDRAQRDDVATQTYDCRR
jgi:tetratricopeptide (TPR) repeat protein